MAVITFGDGAMNDSSTRHMTGSKTKETRRCIRCSAEPKMVGTMLDLNKGRTIRMFKCQCGERTWIADPPNIPIPAFLRREQG